VAPRDRPHILVRRPASAEDYTSYATGRGSPRPPPPIRAEHAQRLTEEAARVALQAQALRAATSEELGVSSVSEGMLVTFESWPGFELELRSLDPQRARTPELLAVHERVTDEERTQFATVYVPGGDLGYFLQRVEQYATQDTLTGKPKHANMVERIAALKLATIREIWTDERESFPEPHHATWWEVWLRRSDGGEIQRLEQFATSTDITIGPRRLVFDNRIILLVHATATQLASALNVIDDFAELRAAHVNSEFFTGLSLAEQAEWIDDLVARTDPASAEAPAACILDTGVNRGHRLLEHSLAEHDLQTCDPTWGAADHHGHGTEIAGLALYGDLRWVLENGRRVRLRHRLESVKIRPPANDTDPALYGAITAEAVSRVEVQAPTRRRAFSMAVTAEQDGTGTPTSWSAAVDALAAGRAFDTVNGELKYIDEASADSHRLFVISAGNVRDLNDTSSTYLDRCDTLPVEDPAQAWNALTVGAYTNLVDVGAEGTPHEGWTPVAQPGDLSPFSRTGVAFQRQWPIKPDIVLEGGNAAASPTGADVDWPESLQILTTRRNPPAFTTINATSAATAQAAQMAATVAAEYPGYWPETVRGLLVHAAEWSPQMRLQMAAAGTSRRGRAAYLRRYGFGVPTSERVLRSATDALTLIVQDTIHPFRRGALREMHLHDLPWPRDELAELGEVPVTMRVTLSYFIEPSPTRRGYRRRYRYASHQLRFDLREPDETNDEFRGRINRKALSEEEERPTRSGDPDGWFVGSETRNRGSLHSDLWQGTAADLAARGLVAIYPVTGWWKELPGRDQSELGARYALLISIETPVEEVDIWTPVAVEAEVPVTVIET
jgi:Subtilase family